MGRMPARFPVNESALNLSSRDIVAALASLDLVSSLKSNSGEAGSDEGAISSIATEPDPAPVGDPMPVSPDGAGGLRAAEEGFEKATVRNVPGSGVTLKSGGWYKRRPVWETGKSRAGSESLN